VIAAVTDASLQGLGALSAQVERLGGVVLIGAGAAQMYLSLYVWEVL